MPDSVRPLSTFDPQGQASVLSYNVPEPTSYRGRHYLSLAFEHGVFTSKARWRPGANNATRFPLAHLAEMIHTGLELGIPFDAIPRQLESLAKLVPEPEAPPTTVRELLDEAPTVVSGTTRGRIFDSRIFSDVGYIAPLLQGNLLTSPGDAPTLGSGPIPAPELGDTDPQLSRLLLASRTAQPTASTSYNLKKAREVMAREYARSLQDGEEPVSGVGMGGEPRDAMVKPTPTPEPQLVLVECYRLSSFLGNYGAGRTIKTVSLLPGEEQVIRVRTFRTTRETTKESHNLLESYDEEVATEFQESIESERTQRTSEDSSFSYRADATASAGWGWGSATVSGGVAGSSNASREEFGRDVASATSKHAAQASAHREVEVTSSREREVEEGMESSIERTIRNINLSRTLNFVFRQMNQEFITLLHLVDIRLAFHNGHPETYREVPMSEMDVLLEEMVEEGHRARVRAEVVSAVENIHDFKDEHHSLLRQREIRNARGETIGKYQSVDRDRTSTYRGDTGALEITVPGIIVAASHNVIRTDGVIVESVLGQGEALDAYSRGLQEQEVLARSAANLGAEQTMARETLAREIVREGDEEMAQRFQLVFPPAGGERD